MVPRDPGGRVTDASTASPVEYANVVLLDSLSGKMVTGVVSDSSGRFRITNVPFGSFILEYSFIGYEKQRSKPFSVTKKHPKSDLGTLTLGTSAISMNEVTITAERSTMITRIDRKVFNLQKDIQAQTGTITDVLQTIPSVSVDMDGNISLRGSPNVTILINGRPSLMTGTENLQQMPASMVEKIEVITNPSAKYTPDGTGGIINIILKKERKAGFNGILGANAGNNDRFNTNLQLNYNTGSFNIFGSYGYRQDYRYRSSDVKTETIDTADDVSTWLIQKSTGWARPRSHLGRLGFDWDIGKKDATGLNGTFDYRQVKRHDTTFNSYQDSLLNPTEVFTRSHDGKQSQNSYAISGYYEHTFNKEDEHQVKVDFEYQSEREKEDDYFTNYYKYPELPDATNHTLTDSRQQNLNLNAEYGRPLWEDASLEAGYAGEFQWTDQDQDVLQLDPDGYWIMYADQQNHFSSSQTIQALFATLSWKWKKFSVMGGLRAEDTWQYLEFRSLDTTATNSYFGLYPTLHLAFDAGKNELQLNYSRRINRPDPEDLNPVPEYRDPRNYFVGNPDLGPEDIHSIEFGYSIRLKNSSFVPTLFYRIKVNGFSMVTSSVNDTTLQTTIENLAKDQSAGLDFSGTATIAKIVSLNFSASGFYSRIDASNIGYGSDRSVFAWNAKLNASVNITKTTIFQFNGQYRSEALTAQGYRKPSWVVNLGFRQDLFKKKLSFIATVSDLFNSQSMRSSVNTPILVSESTRRRDARVMYAGFLFNFGSSGKKAKEAKFEYDNGMDRN